MSKKQVSDMIFSMLNDRALKPQEYRNPRNRGLTMSLPWARILVPTQSESNTLQ
jgi:hypothetical protein